MKSFFLFLLLFPIIVSAQYDSTKNRQTINAYGFTYKNVAVTGSFLIPNDTPRLAVADSNAIATLNGRVFVYTGWRWNSFEVVMDSDPNKLDSVTYRSDTLWQWKNGDSSLIGELVLGSLYTFSNGLNESSAGNPKLGGALTAATSLWNNTFQYSYRVSGTDSIIVGTTNSGAWRADRRKTGVANNLIVDDNMYFEVNDGTSQSAGLEFLNNGSGTLSTRFQDSRTVKTGLEYISHDTTGWTAYTLITRNYLNQRLAGFSGGGIADSIQNITTDTVVTITNGVNIVYVNPATSRDTIAITLPASPSTSKTIEFYFGGTITSGTVVTLLTIAGNSGQTILQATTPTIFEAGEYVSYKWNSSLSKWYRKN